MDDSQTDLESVDPVHSGQEHIWFAVSLLIIMLVAAASGACTASQIPAPTLRLGNPYPD